MDDAVPPGLRYGTDDEPGISRHGHRRPRYRDQRTGALVTDHSTLDRIRQLAIPPAWTDVWISADPTSHVQATGRDAKRRKQYRYHPAYRAHQEAAKFDLMARYGRALPALRRTVAQDLRRRELDQRCVVAVVVQLLEDTLIRVGNEEYARERLLRSHDARSPRRLCERGARPFVPQSS